MSRYLLIESRDPFESRDTQRYAELASGLRADGHDVLLFLVQDGVLPARVGARSAPLSQLAESGVEVRADEFSLRERGIPADRLTPGVRPASIDLVVDELAAGAKALWH